MSESRTQSETTVICPHCGVSGAHTLNYGPEATPGEAEVLLALPDADDEIRSGIGG